MERTGIPFLSAVLHSIIVRPMESDTLAPIISTWSGCAIGVAVMATFFCLWKAENLMQEAEQGYSLSSRQKTGIVSPMWLRQLETTMRSSSARKGQESPSQGAVTISADSGKSTPKSSASRSGPSQSPSEVRSDPTRTAVTRSLASSERSLACLGSALTNGQRYPITGNGPRLQASSLSRLHQLSESARQDRAPQRSRSWDGQDADNGRREYSWDGRRLSQE